MLLIHIQEANERSIQESLTMIGYLITEKYKRKMIAHRNTLEIIDLLIQWAKEFVLKFPDLHPGEEWFYEMEIFVMEKVDLVRIVRHT